MNRFKDTLKTVSNKEWISRNIRKIVVSLVVICSAMIITVGAVQVSAGSIDKDKSQGIVYAKDVSLNTKIPGRIVKFYVEEGQKIKAGDPIVEISSEELQAKKAQLEAQIEQAQAGVDASKALLEMAQGNYSLSQERVKQAEAGLKASQSQRDMAKAVSEKAENGARTQEVAQAESAYNLWKSTYDRAKVLYEGGALTKQKLEEIKTQMDVSEQTLNMAKEGARSEDKKAALAQLSMAEAGVQSSASLLNQANEASNIALAQVNQAQAGLTAAQGKLEQAKAGQQEVEVYLQDTLIKSPIDGTVTALNSDEGELVSTGTSIGTVSNLDKCWVSANLDEYKLSDLSEGQSVDVNLPAYKGKKFIGKIVTINKQPDFAVKKATSENGNIDIVSYEVKIELDNHDELIRPGMTAIVDFAD
ncbi:MULTISPECIES: HlyD family secretion protein [unclassified Sedimentibacter]|uniref:HlyD family secretion protein n=1 Tax=unclassified Sedimentibacter TaxID=2649220 RepID=UPI0027E16335|nr:efflux RND transporter periplasmic adaptor subunit [Sedimentibacter sp. MB35-C1]WMJ75747.1 efflux RND transporter periplasmic adaptor subunit [Sedimentibacter sp. MB35-C1]